MKKKQQAIRPNNMPPPLFDSSRTIRDWDNITFDDITICLLCGKKELCECDDNYYCPCGKKNKDCEWPESIMCPCRVCGEVWRLCLCDKPEGVDDKKWLEIKEFQYYDMYPWHKEVEDIIELLKIDNESESDDEDNE
jgi:hypothetical protein